MFRFVLLSIVIAAASAQHGGNGYHSNPKTAAILSEQRYLSGDGTFGAAYTQEDGTDFKEETDADGTRHGAYSYIDPSGQKRTVKYTAGKNGFQASGDHLPVAPPAPPQPIPQANYRPDPQYQPPQYQSQKSQGDDYEDGSYDPRYNDPSFSQNNQGYRAPAPAPAPAPQYNYNSAPQYNNNPSSNYNSQPAQYNNYNQQPQQQYNNYQTTPTPNRFQPPGKLQLNRTPDGFSYSFNKV